MPFNQFILMVVMALAVTIPIVRLIPRARQSPAFDRLLWVATFVIAFLGSWAAIGYIVPGSNLAFLNSIVALDTPVLTLLAGALAAALFLNILLWVMDQFSQPEVDDEGGGEDGIDEYPIPPEDGGERVAENSTPIQPELEQPQPEPQDVSR